MIESKEVTIHVGLHKTATTFLQSEFFHLYSNELGYVNLRKDMREFLYYVLFCNDLDYDSQEATRLFLTKLKDANTINRKILLSDEQFCGSPWDNAVSRKRYFDRLNVIFPNAKYIIVLRNQEEMVRSLYLQYIKTGGSATWKEFLSHKTHPLSFGLKSYLNYGAYINYMVKLVGIERVGCFFYEDMQKNTQIFLANIAKFAGFKLLDETTNIIGRRKNPSITYPWLKFLLFANKFFRSYREPFLLFPQSIHLLIVKLIIKMPPSTKKVFIPKQEVSSFCEEAKRNNSIIKKIYSRDISEIGY